MSAGAGVWFQTSNFTPFLYIPPIEVRFDDGMPHLSSDVLVAVALETGDHFLLYGWFNFYVYQWQYYGVDPVVFTEYNPHYWTFTPPTLPNGW
jgi:hypothetical protein